MDEFIFGDEIPTNEYILLTMVKYGLKLCEITTQSQFLIDKLFICVHMFSIVFQFFFPFWFHMFPLGISRFPLGHPIFFHLQALQKSLRLDLISLGAAVNALTWTRAQDVGLRNHISG